MKTKPSERQLNFLKNLNYLNGDEIKDLFRGNTSEDVLLDPDDYEIYEILGESEDSVVLEKLRLLNQGCNPEYVSQNEAGIIEEGEADSGYSFWVKRNGESYKITNAQNEIDYILNYRGIYGIVYKNRYYRLL